MVTYDSALNSVAIGLIAYAALGLIERLDAFDWPTMPRTFRWTLYYGMITSILLFARFESRSFIYFQF